MKIPNVPRGADSEYPRWFSKLRTWARGRFSASTIIISVLLIVWLTLPKQFESWRPLAQVTSLFGLLIYGVGRYFASLLSFLAVIFWIPARAIIRTIADNWEAFVLFWVEATIALRRQKAVAVIAALGIVSSVHALEFRDSISGWFAIAAAFCLVVVRLFSQYGAHLGRNDFLDRLASVVEQYGLTKGEKPKLRRDTIKEQELGDEHFQRVISQLMAYWLFESILAKIKRQYVRLAFHLTALCSLLFSLGLICLSAWIATAGITVITQQAHGQTFLDVGLRALRQILKLESNAGPEMGVVAWLALTLIALQIPLFFRTINETSKVAVDGFLKRLELGLEALRRRKASEIAFVFGRSPDELAVVIKERGDKYARVVELFRSGRTSQAIQILVPPKDKTGD